MTLLSVVRDVCAVVGVQQPVSVTSNLVANRTMQEMLSLANEMAQRISYDNRDWTRMLTTATITGDGVAESFLLPADYKRMTLTANVRRYSMPQHPLMFIPDIDQWNERRLTRAVSSPGEWMFFAGRMFIRPILPLGEIAIFPYVQKNCIGLASGGYGDHFMADTDSFALDERLLKLGMIWQWKQNKGTSYAEDMGTYETAMSVAAGHDRPAPIIIGRRPMSWNARTENPSQTIYVPGMVP